MKAIHKYSLQRIGSQLVNVPHEIEIVSILEQDNVIVVYGIVDSEDKKFPREFRVYGTGHPLDEDIEDFRFLGTVSTENGALMWHVFIDRSDE